jgi:1-hydroxy-2-methyl-2-(E)-butenyl 4-diphosphate synthase
MNLFNYTRRKSSEVKIGNVTLGGKNPILIQSMANTSTNDIEGSVEQAIRIINKGADYLRLTTQGLREVDSLKEIHTKLREKGYATPLVADVHFNASVALAVASVVEKVRINPGNFVDVARTFKKLEFTDEEYAQEVEKISEKLIPFLNICKENNTAVRLGVNHGSLSDRIMSRYGDTPEGMVESCMEFLRICINENFYNLAISIKASNTVVMVRTVRLMVAKMEEEGMAFPLHLGVTEAGNAEDGRVKSALGIGALLADGYGDTIRVSLSEAPENEIPVARKLVDYIAERNGHAPIEGAVAPDFNYFAPVRRKSIGVKGIGGSNAPVVVGLGDSEIAPFPDFLITANGVTDRNGSAFPFIQASDMGGVTNVGPSVMCLTYPELNADVIEILKNNPAVVILLMTSHQNGVGEQRAFFHKLLINEVANAVVINRDYQENDVEDLMLKAAADFGPLLQDGFGDGILITNNGTVSDQQVNNLMFGILQAARLRMSKTEFISCPGCGRTLFDLESTIAKVKDATSHLKNLKIGIMGCIVNGPGEMADADYGYVGAGRGKISLYKQKECVEKNIPEEEAVEKLVALIKQYGDWKEKV